MITADEITAVGIFTKTHGLKGEMHALLDIDPEFFLSHDCLVIDVEGIYVPFFVESVRPKGHTAVLIKPADVNDEAGAGIFAGKTIYVNKDLLADYEEIIREDGDQGAYADDFVGFTLLDTAGNALGEITDVETSTANTLFIVHRPQESGMLYVPVAEEFICNIDMAGRKITMQLPDGLLDLNN